MKHLSKEARANRKKYRKKRKKYVPSKAANIALENMEQATLDLLDPIKNAKDKELFMLDTNPNARPKMVKDKVTWGERATSSRGLGVKLPKYTGKSFKEKRVIGGLKDLDIVNAKVARMTGGEKEKKKGGEKKGEKVEGEEEEDVMEIERPEGTEEPKAKRVKVEAEEKKPATVLVKKETKVESNGNKVVVEKSSVKVYDLWGAAPERPVNPKQSFIHEVLYPKKRSFTPDLVQTKLPAIALPQTAESYRPDPESHNELKRKRDKKEKMEQKAADEANELIENLQGPGFFLPLSKDNNDGEEEENDPVRAEPQKHKTEKEKRIQHEKNVRKDQEHRTKVMKKRQKEIARASEIMKELDKEEKEREERAAQRKERREQLEGTQARTANNKLVSIPAASGLISAPSERLRTINAIVNPLKERILSMKSRGLINEKKNKNPRSKPLYKYVEPPLVQDYIKADEEKYLQPILNQIRRAK